DWANSSPGEDQEGSAMSCRRVGRMVAAGLLVVGTLLTTAAPVGAKSHIDVLLSDLASPKALFAGPKDVFVGQGWSGPPGPILDLRLTGRGRGTATAITDPVPVADI